MISFSISGDATAIVGIFSPPLILPTQMPTRPATQLVLAANV